MAERVTLEQVRHIASLARLGVSDERAATLATELSSILAHMQVLSEIDTEGVQEAIGVGARGMPVRGDHGPPIALERSLDVFVPSLRDGLLLVPRLASHQSADNE